MSSRTRDKKAHTGIASGPATQERKRHGAVAAARHPVTDTRGGSGQPFVGEDIINRYRRAGRVELSAALAARQFQRLFHLAGLEQLRAADLERSSGAGRVRDIPLGNVRARRSVMWVIDQLGGITSPAGSVVFHVLGLGESLNRWASERGVKGRPVNHHAAQGMLEAALGVLKTLDMTFDNE